LFKKLSFDPRTPSVAPASALMAFVENPRLIAISRLDVATILQEKIQMDEVNYPVESGNAER